MVARVLAIALLVALIGCATPHGRAGLTSTEATRLADLKARSIRRDFGHYDRLPAHYDAADDSWWVSYRRKSAKYTAFSVQIETKSKKAWVVLPKRSPATPGARARVTGSGVVLMEVDYNTGRVSNVRMLRSTGNRILDDAATSAFRKYSYRPRTFRGLVKIPITFTLTDTKR